MHAGSRKAKERSKTRIREPSGDSRDCKVFCNSFIKHHLGESQRDPKGLYETQRIFEADGRVGGYVRRVQEENLKASQARTLERLHRACDFMDR